MTKHQTKKFVQSSLKVNGYGVTIEEEDFGDTQVVLLVDHPDDDEDDDSAELLRVDIETLPYCCGVEEIGNIDLYGHIFDAGSKNSMLLAIAYLFIKLHERAAAGGKGKARKGLIFNSNSVGACAIIDKALAMIPAYWQCVSKTINPSGGRTIKMWVAIP